MNIQDYVLAQKYAQAFLNVFPGILSLEDISKLEELIQLLHDRSDIQTYLKIPLGRKFKQKCFDQLWARYNLPESFYMLSNILIRQHRAYLCALVLSCIITIFYERHGYMQFTISSSHTLTQKMLDAVHQFLSRSTKKNILTKVDIDKTLIAGIRLQSTDLLWESSIKQRLQEVAEKCNEEVL